MSQSLARGLRILTDLETGPRSLDEVAGTLEVHKSTALRLLRTLEAERFVRKDTEHRYHLGSALFSLGTSALEHHSVRDAALPHLHELSTTTGGQTVHMAVLENAEPVYIAKVESTHAVRMYSRVGLAAPLHATAVGKVLASELPEGELEAVIARTDFQRFTPNTASNADEFRARLAEVRTRGWAEDAAEHEEFINCIAAPIRDEAGRIVSAVSVSVPRIVLDRDQVRELVPDLLDSARDIQHSWTGPASGRSAADRASHERKE